MSTTTVCSFDFETGSECDLLTHGIERYSRDPSTQVYCMSFRFDQGDVLHWRQDDDHFPHAVLKHVRNGGIMRAFNAQFEFLIWNRVLTRMLKGLPPLKLEQVRCTAYQGRANGLVGPLDMQARQMGTEIYKDPRGMQLIQTYSANGVHWVDIPAEDQDAWLDYCDDDVLVESALADQLRELTPAELRDYHLIEKMNQRGVPVDVEFAEAALHLANPIRDDVNRKIEILTAGMVKTYTERKNRDLWLRQELTEDQIEVITARTKKKDKKTGEEVERATIVFDKNARLDLAALEDLPDSVRQFLDLVDEGGGATISKYLKVLDTEVDGRVYNSFMGCGGHTGRMSSRVLQLQNLRRDGFDADEADRLIMRVIDGKPIDNPTDTLGRLVRAVIYAPAGLTVQDWSGIENVVLYWLADDQARMDAVVAGADEYVELAAAMYGIPEDEVDKTQRLMGKIGILACNYAGGVGAIRGMARNFRQFLTEDEATAIRDGYRRSHPLEVSLWYDIEDAARRAVLNPGVEYEAAGGLLGYESDGDNLWLQLPSGRFLRYHKPRVEMKEMPWGEEKLSITVQHNQAKPKKGESEWPRRSLSPGTLTENACQAISNDLLRHTMDGCDRAGIDIIAAVHDELVAEGPDCTKQLRRIMLTRPDWAEGMPLAVDGSFGYTYGK